MSTMRLTNSDSLLQNPSQPDPEGDDSSVLCDCCCMEEADVKAAGKWKLDRLHGSENGVTATA